MSATRREFLAAACASALGAPRWSADRIGIFCGLGTEETSARRVLAAARSAGFRRVQVSFPWPRVSEAWLKALPAWVREEGLEAEVLSAYVNCVSPETVIMDCRREDFARAIDYAGALGARCLAAWTGGYGAGLMEADPRNQAAAASEAIVRFLEPQAKRIEEARLALALETYITLACPDAPSLGRVLDRLPKCIGAVLDPPNLTPIGRYGERDRVLREMVATLKGRVAVVHLKDFSLAPDGRSYRLPGPLEGEMNYSLFARQILSLPGGPPIIAEHLAPEKFAEARRKLLPVFEAAAR